MSNVVNAEKVVGSVYITAFHDQLNLFTGDVAKFRAIQKKLLFKAGGDTKSIEKNTDDVTKQDIETCVMNFQFYLGHLIPKGKTIASKTNYHDFKKIETAARKVTDKYIPDIKDLEEVVDMLHEFLGENVLQQLLTNSQETISMITQSRQ